MGDPPHTSGSPSAVDTIPSPNLTEQLKQPEQHEQLYSHPLHRHPRQCTMDPSLYYYSYYYPYYYPYYSYYSSSSSSSQSRAVAVRPESYLAVRQTDAYRNLPPAVDVETVEEARRMLDRWEAWNQQLPKQLEMDAAFSAVHPLNEQESLTSPLLNTSPIQISHDVGKGRRSRTSLVQNRTETSSNTSAEFINHFVAGSRRNSEIKGNCIKPRPFAVAYRVTAATIQRRIQPNSTRRSRALLLKRALDLEGKPLGRTGEDLNDVKIDDYPSACRDDRSSTSDINIPFAGVELSTEPGTSEVKEKQDPLAVMERLRFHLQGKIDVLSEANSVISRAPNSSVTDSNSDCNSTWPIPPSHFQYELDDCKEFRESIQLIPCDPLLISKEEKEKEKEEKSSKSPSPPHGVSLEGTEENKILMESEDDIEEDSEDYEEKEEEVKEEMKVIFFSSDSDSPPQGFPIMLLKDHAISIFPTPQIPEDQVELKIDSESDMELPTRDGTESVDDDGVLKTMEEVNGNDVSSYDSREIEQSVYSNKASLLSFEEKEVQSYDSNNNNNDKSGEKESDNEDEKNQWNVNTERKEIFEYEEEHQEKEKEEKTETIADNESAATIFMPQVTQMANEVMTDECNTRMSLILEETLQLCELWRNYYTEDLHMADTLSNSLNVRDTTMMICTTDHACMNDAFTQCNMEEPNIILTSQQQQQQQQQEQQQQQQLSKGERHCRGSPRHSWRSGWLWQWKYQQERKRKWEFLLHSFALTFAKENFMELKSSLMTSESEVNQLKELLEKESTTCTSLKSELVKTLDELQRVNDMVTTTATAVKAGEEREVILMEKVYTLEAQLREKEIAMQQRCEEAERDAERFNEETTRLHQKIVELEERQEESEQTERDIKSSLMASKSEVNQLKELLEKESTTCTSLQSELAKTLEELQRVNDTATTAAAEAVQEREAITAQLQLAQSDAAAIAQAACVRQSELQSEALESTVRERRALYFAAALERSLLFAISRGAECTARLGLLHTMKKRDDGSMTCNALYDLHAYNEERSRAQLLAAIAVIARSASHALARRCFSQWGRVCYEARSQRMAFVRRENRERRRELTLWCDYLSLVKSDGVWRDAGQRGAAVGDVHRTLIRKSGTSPLIHNTNSNNTNNNNTINTISNTSHGGSRTVLDASETETVMRQLDAKEDSPALLDLKSMLTRERERNAKLMEERNALRDALRDSTAVNTELLQQLESELKSRYHPAAV